MNTPRYYVHRINADGRHGWVGPLVAAKAEREAAAWRTEGWAAEVHPNDTTTRDLVKAWQHAADDRHGRRHVRIPAADHI